jgi:hypothetical protein
MDKTTEKKPIGYDDNGAPRHHVLVSDIVKKELKRCRFKDTEKNVLKIISRYKVAKVIKENKARKIIHTLIMTNASILEK